MLPLTDHDYLARLLKSHGLYTQKHLGQHFLIDQSVLTAIVQAANIQSTDTILEIGTGIGVLTQELAQRANRVIAFEIDTHLQPALAQVLQPFSNVELHFQDFLKSGFEKAGLATENQGLASLQPSSLANSYKLVANLPYNAGSHILDVLLKSPNPPQSITVLLQNEVAQKITAAPPHATYLSNFFQLYGSAHIEQIVPPSSFFPAPKVDSAILHVSSIQNSALNQPNPVVFSKFLHRGFAQPRKMLNKAFSLQELQAANITPQQRPENLTFEDWLKLFKEISSH